MILIFKSKTAGFLWRSIVSGAILSHFCDEIKSKYQLEEICMGMFD